MSRAQGWEAGPGQLGKVVGEIRRAMSVTIVRANSLCLLERLSQLGPGARAAAQRRQAALHLEERRRQERQAFDLAWQARRSSRVGRAFIELWSFVKIYLPFSSILILPWCWSCNIHLINGIQVTNMRYDPRLPGELQITFWSQNGGPNWPFGQQHFFTCIQLFTKL